MDQHKEVFLQEAYELIEELEVALLALEEKPQNVGLIDRVFRALHTLKGSGAMFGFDDIAFVAHEIETAFDLVRDGRMAITSELINLTLQARDIISEMLVADTDGHENLSERARGIMAAIQAMLPTEDTVQKTENQSDRGEKDNITVEKDETIFRIRFAPHQDIFRNGTNPLLLLDELGGMGKMSIAAHAENIPELTDFDAEDCYLFWDIVLTTQHDQNTIKDVFIFVEDDCDLDIRPIELPGDGYLQPGVHHKRIGEILVERGDVSDDDIRDVLKQKKQFGEHLVEAKKTSPSRINSAVMEQEHVKNILQKRQKDLTGSSIRVDAQKLDTLVNLVGELVTVQARLTQKSTMENDPDLVGIAEEVERLTAELRDTTMSVRMLPIGSTFATLQRLVRDLARELGKEVQFTTDGGETELDKNIIEKLKDPLVHIIRNSIDHGIELPHDREANQKNRKGNIHISATHSGANVIITISDDGKGLDVNRIRQKAIDRGIISPETAMPENEIYGLIFEAGFSTANAVTGVSGRGVGMDVVKKSIESLRGTIDVRSKRGDGLEIVLKLPLTLAIIDGLMVKIDGGDFILPLTAVEECVELRDNDLKMAIKRKIMNIRGEVLPYVRLRELFGSNGNQEHIEQVVVVESNGDRFGLGVDRVVGQLQTVIKSIGYVYKDIKGTSGATILGDGSVALILDILDITQLSEEKNKKGEKNEVERS